VNGAGQSAPTAVAGPIAPAASTAPAPGSLNVALSYSEQNAADTVNNPGYARAWGAARQFLDDRAVGYTVVRDSDWPAEAIGRPKRDQGRPLTTTASQGTAF